MPWSDIWVPAVVAAFVTLVIEYAAKPQLDARKERILEGGRLRREALSLIHLGHSNYGMLSDMMNIKSKSRSGEGHDLVQEEVRRLKAEILGQAVALVRRARLIDDDSDPLLFEALTALAGIFLTVGHTGVLYVSEDELTRAAAMSSSLLGNRPRSRAGRVFRTATAEWLKRMTTRSMEESDDSMQRRRSD